VPVRHHPAVVNDLYIISGLFYIIAGLFLLAIGLPVVGGIAIAVGLLGAGALLAATTGH